MGKYSRLAGMSHDATSATRKMKSSMQKSVGGGYNFVADPFTQFKRFLILGTEGDTYYVRAPRLTRENVNVTKQLLREDPLTYLNVIEEVYRGGLAPKRDALVFSLALMFVEGNHYAKQIARQRYNRLVRTGNDHMMFARYLVGTKEHGVRTGYMRGWGRSVRSTIKRWYEQKPLEALVYQMIKYRNRHGFSHGTLIELSHPRPGSKVRSDLFKWALDGSVSHLLLQSDETRQLEGYIRASETVNAANEPIMHMRDTLIRTIADYRLPWEAIPNAWLNDPLVLASLLENMPPVAMVRNIPRFTWTGALDSQYVKSTIVSRLESNEYVTSTYLHPMNMLKSKIVYNRGYGERSRWTPDRDVADAMEAAFYHSFDNVEPTGLNYSISVDVSGSMAGSKSTYGRWPNCTGMDEVTPREAAAVMAMVIARTEPKYYLSAFSTSLMDLPITPDMKLEEVVRVMNRLPAGGTNISAPIVASTKSRLPVDVFIVVTDNELNYGKHPAYALQEHRDRTGRNSKLATVAMVSYRGTIADPDDGGMMDFVGFDPTTPKMIAMFAKGELS